MPVAVVLLDFRKTYREVNHPIPATHGRVTQPFNMVTWSVEFEKEFITEEEFKV